MTPSEFFFRAKNGSPKLKQLALITFLFLEYIYIYIYIYNIYILSYQPSSFASSKMSEIPTNTKLERKLLTIEKKIK